jgi:hypothetical protein
MQILDKKVKIPQNRVTELLKFQWTYYIPKYATWEHEYAMQVKIPCNKSTCNFLNKF